MPKPINVGAGQFRHPRSRPAREVSRAEHSECDSERAGAVAFLIRRHHKKRALRVRYCSRAGLGVYPCKLSAFCRPCTGVAKLDYEDRVVALCALALSDNPHLVFLAGDFTVGETKSSRYGVRLVKSVLSSVQESGSKAWARIVGVIYSIEIGKSRTGKWWVHVHTFLALDSRDQPPTRKAFAREWARKVRVTRWPKKPFDPRSECDRLYERLMRSQSIKPLHAYTRKAMTTRIVPVASLAEIEPDLRARARYLRERNGEPGHERVLALTWLTEDDRLAIMDLRARLNARTGVFRNHKEPEVRALAAQLRAQRRGDLSRRRLFSVAAAIRARLTHVAGGPVRPSSQEFRSRLRARHSVRP